MPNDPAELIKLPGIGKATAASIAAFAFNAPTLFIETNIRTVFIHHFLPDENDVNDGKILSLLEQVLDKRNPYKFYSAIMDYGTHLKQLHPNPSRKSSAYVRQSKFEGSNRQLRGAVLRMVLKARSMTVQALQKKLGGDQSKISIILDALAREGLITRNKNRITI